MYLSAVSASRCRTPRRGSRCGPARRGRCWTSARARRWSPGTGGRGASCATAPPSPPGSSIYRAPASCSDGGGCLRCINYFVLFICTYFIHSTVSVNKRLSNGGEESGDGQRTSIHLFSGNCWQIKKASNNQQTFYSHRKMSLVHSQSREQLMLVVPSFHIQKELHN